MIKFDSARYLDDKIKKSNLTTQGGKRLKGLDMYTGPIKNELIGAGLFLIEDRKQMLKALYQKEKAEILQEFEEQELSLYSRPC
ncbi:hypothetical protein DOY81_006817 [Sarcophaga bullata]|nr:hypothetical protein DOY81_006817 [Sarcophaga bullata]